MWARAHRCRRGGLWVRTAALAAAAGVLAGCWTPPSARVRPLGAPRIVLDELIARSAREAAVVRSVDHSARSIALDVHGILLERCRIGPHVHRWRTLRPGERVHVRFTERLSVYVPPPGQVRHPVAIRVLFVDPSYRLLGLRYSNGSAATLKALLGTPLQQVQAGDAVAVRSVTLVALDAPRRDGS